MAKENENKRLAENRKAFHEYFIEQTFEAGIELVGTEVKSIRAGKVNLKDSYGEIRNNEIYICNMHISPYEQGNIYNRDPLRNRRLLLHKSQIRTIIGTISQKGYTLIPISLYLKDRRVKVALGIAKGKKNYDKRDAMIEKDAKRDIARQFKENQRY
ncbi:MAG: SsrA-binding protein SmpB [Clostridiaceae bacterium]